MLLGINKLILVYVVPFFLFNILLYFLYLHMFNCKIIFPLLSIMMYIMVWFIKRIRCNHQWNSAIKSILSISQNYITFGLSLSSFYLKFGALLWPNLKCDHTAISIKMNPQLWVCVYKGGIDNSSQLSILINLCSPSKTKIYISKILLFNKTCVHIFPNAFLSFRI